MDKKQRIEKVESLTKQRAQQLWDLGLKFNFGENAFRYENGNVFIDVPSVDILAMEPDKWAALMEQIKAKINEKV